MKYRQLLIGGLAIGSVLLLYLLVDARKGFFPPCPLYAVSHIYCPGCGTQRALSALLHGELLQAVRYNPLFAVFGLLLVGWMSVLVATGGKKR